MLDPSAHLSEDQLSAHIDGQLAADEASLAQSHLSSCQSCHAALAELQSTIQLLRALPQLRPPRSFQIEPAPPSLWSRLMQWDIGVRGLAAATAALFVVMVSGDLTAPSQSTTSIVMPLEQAAAPTSAALAPGSAPAAAPAAPAPRSAPAKFSITPGPAPTTGTGAAGTTAAAPQQAESDTARSVAEVAQKATTEAKVARDVINSARDPLGSLRVETFLAGLATLAMLAVVVARTRRRA